LVGYIIVALKEGSCLSSTLFFRLIIYTRLSISLFS